MKTWHVSVWFGIVNEPIEYAGLDPDYYLEFIEIMPEVLEPVICDGTMFLGIL